MPAAALREMPDDAIELIKSFEGLPDGDPATVNLDAYLDPLGIWTIGWGHAVSDGGRHLRGAENKARARALFPGGITRDQAQALLRADLLDRSPSLLNCVKVPLTDAQFGALMSFVFNCGIGNLQASTLLKLLNARNYAGAADQFLVWNKGRKNGVLVELPGLTRRRRAERALFLSADWRAAGAVAPATRGLPETGAARSGPPARARAIAPERPVRPSATSQRAAAIASGGRGVAELAAKPRASKKAAKPAARKAVKKAAPRRAAGKANGGRKKARD